MCRVSPDVWKGFGLVGKLFFYKYGPLVPVLPTQQVAVEKAMALAERGLPPTIAPANSLNVKANSTINVVRNFKQHSAVGIYTHLVMLIDLFEVVCFVAKISGGDWLTALGGMGDSS